MSQSTAQRKRKPSGGRKKKRALGTVTGIGVVLALLGVALVAVNLFFLSHAYDLSSWEDDVTVPGGLFALPGGLFLVAMCFIFTGRVLRGHVSTTTPKGLEGGTVVSSNTYLSPRAHLAWLGVALAFWIVLIPVPVLLSLGGGWPQTVSDAARGQIWVNLVLYGGLAAAIAGVLFVSHLKKQHYLALSAADNLRLDEPQRGIWRWLTFRWRFDLWLGAFGGAFIGVSFAFLPYVNPAALVILLAIGAVPMVLGVLLARQYWRAKLPLGLAESFA
ncbi:hypothetical protein [Arthrobacter sp. zg-Y1171]|uniref:hypothetical protein n=1 Tax=Arthrobacter sp. zg-Y1171 TaxID=2964610 RepID=UPI002107AD23|nr:hypothetical protein [Arthrobacter sp. zg-Y1171]MCQ1995169.1 hypothetical protein [Arthrobacter sp. zg-Y1171]UWX80787.1 hypothetical protein N2L00_10150 [Arthrobacter sp. zg-Y1171]